MQTESREINSIRNFLVGISKQLLILALNLVSKAIFIKSLGAVFVGINGIFTNIFLILSFTEFGIGSVMAYSLYAPLDRFDKGEISTIYHFFRKIYIRLSLIILSLGILIVPLLPFIVNTKETVAHVSAYYLLYLSGILITNMFMYKSHIILADQKEYLLSFYSMCFEVSAIFLQIYILIKTQDYALFLIVFIFKNALYAMAVSHKLAKLYPFLKDQEALQLLAAEERGKIYEKIWDVFTYRFARVFMTGTDNILISILVGTVWLGYYSNYDMIIVGVASLITTFYSGISASVGNLIAKENIQVQYNVFETVQILNMWIVGFTTTCLYLLFQDFLSLWIGTQYVLDFKIVLLIIINYYLVCNRKLITIFREAAGMFKKMMKIMLLAAGLNIVISIILGYFLGLSGVLLGTMITALATYYWYEPRILLKDKFMRSVKSYFKNQIETLAYTAVSIALTGLIIILAINTANFTELTIGSFILKVCICLVVPNLFYLLVLSRKEGFSPIKDMGRRFYKSIRNR